MINSKKSWNIGFAIMELKIHNNLFYANLRSTVPLIWDEVGFNEKRLISQDGRFLFQNKLQRGWMFC